MLLRLLIGLLFLNTSLVCLSWSATCNQFDKGHASESIAKDWEKKLNSFFSSSTPNYSEIEKIVEKIKRIDTSRITEFSSNQISTTFQNHAKILINSVLTPSTTAAQLRNNQSKLRLLKETSFRNLLIDETLKSKVGIAAWVYNDILWDQSIPASQKAIKIKNLLAKRLQDFNKQSEIQSNKIYPSVKVEIVQEDVFNVNAEAVIISVSKDGFCASTLHSKICPQVKTSLEEGLRSGLSTQVVHKSTSPELSRNLILVVDDLSKPLAELIAEGLREAERAGYANVALPTFRMGDVFGAIDYSEDNIAKSILNGIADFSKDRNAKLNKITIAVLDNQAFSKKLETQLEKVKETRERSLRSDIREVKLSGEQFTLTPSSTRVHIDLNSSPIYRDMLKPWNLSYMMDNHAPIKLATLKDTKTFDKPVVSVLNMPIKMPGTNYRIPEELEQFREFLQVMIDHEASVNPKINSFYTYITVDHSFVRSGKTQRAAGIHIDGVQGARCKEKLPPEHTYSVTNKVGTVFYDQPFDLRTLNPDTEHVHAELERQAKTKNKIFTKNYEVYFWDSYSAHEAANTKESTLRTFVRVEFSKKIYDGRGDTKSPLFIYDWTPVDRPIPENLNDGPGNKPGGNQ